ncbi:hypothetical protein B0H10DRAFT_1814675, partial [Mycena sp. CBHHK59/15]
PHNVKEAELQFVMEHDGLLPATHQSPNMNETCIFTVHPRIGLKHCRIHVVDGKIIPASMQPRQCPTEMIVFIPVEAEKTPATRYKALVILRNAHNHPMHPKIKPSSEDRVKLGTAVRAIGLTGLTPMRLLNGECEVAPSTSIVYDGHQVAEQSPAFTDTRKVRDFISTEKRKEHPQGLGWDGSMDEWEVVGFLDRAQRRVTFGSLYCDTKKTEVFEQLFTELFATVKNITGETFKLAPFFPEAKCHIIMLDGEVAQGLGLGDFLISKAIIQKLKSIMWLTTQEEIDEWDRFAAAQTHPAIHNWYLQKMANPWILPSINKFLSKISNNNWDITPNHSNLVKTAHAGRNAETAIGVALLTGIMQAQERDNIIAAELNRLDQNGVMRHRFNGSAEREKLSAQRKVWNMRKTAARNDHITGYEELKAERENGLLENKASLEREGTLQAQVKSLRDAIQLDKRRTDLKEQLNEVRTEIEQEKSGRREWVLRRAELDRQINELRSGPLAGTRINGRRPTERPTGEIEPLAPSTQDVTQNTMDEGVVDDSGVSHCFYCPVQWH